MELLDIVDENGEPTGKTIEREMAHSKGIRHRTSHVWVVRYKNKKPQVLLQKRSKDKDAYPGCFDISSAGHIPAGCGYIESAMRELKEELGLDSKEDEYIYCGVRKAEGVRENIFHGNRFLDNQVSNVYIIYRDIPAEDINFQREEIESVMWMDLDKCMQMVDKNELPNCIVMEELEMLKAKISPDKKETLSKTWVVCLLAMICCFLWGSAFPSIKIGYKLFDIISGDYPSQILFAGIRFTIAGIMVIAVNSIINRKFIMPSKPFQIFTLSIFQTSLQYMFFYIGLANTAGVKSSIINGSGVFLTIIVAGIIFRQEKVTCKKIIGSILGFAGIVLVNMSGENIDLSFTIIGEVFIFFSALASAFSSAFIKKFSKTTDVVMLSGYQFFCGGTMLMILGVLFGGNITQVNYRGVLMLIYLAFISAAAYTIWSILLKHNTVSKVAVFKFMNPLFGALLSALILPGENQEITYITVAALVLVCLGIIVVNKENEQSKDSYKIKKRGN